MTDSQASQSPAAQSLVIPTSVSRLHPALALRDLKSAALNWPLWAMLGWQDILQRYRRSTLGPFWLTISMGVMVAAIGLVYGALLKQDLNSYVPYVALGFIFWNFISGTMNDGCQTFVVTEKIIKQSRLPLSLHVFRVVYRQSIIFAHNFVIYLVVVIVFQLWPTWNLLWAIPALVVWVMNSLWLTLVLGMVCARFRDIPPIVGSVVQLMFLVTPIIWKAELMGHRAILAHANPVYHFMEILRGPFLGQAPDLESWCVVLAITAMGWLFTFELFRRYRWRIAYWL